MEFKCIFFEAQPKSSPNQIKSEENNAFNVPRELFFKLVYK